jgi:hypothetical protein
MVNEDKVNVRTDEEIMSTGQGSGASSGDPGGQGSLNQRDTSGYPNI